MRRRIRGSANGSSRTVTTPINTLSPVIASCITGIHHIHVNNMLCKEEPHSKAPAWWLPTFCRGTDHPGVRVYAAQWRWSATQ